ncbi:hypothetical protein ACVWW6_008977 [Bradyrhizobium sp. USDA 3311]
MQNLKKPQLPHIRNDIVNDRVIIVPKLTTVAHTRDKIVKEIGSLKRHFRSMLSIWIEAARVPRAYETTKGRPRRLQGDAGSLQSIGGGDGRLEDEPVYDPADMAAGGAFASLGYEGGVGLEHGFMRKEDEAPHFPATRGRAGGVRGRARQGPARQAGGATGRAADGGRPLRRPCSVRLKISTRAGAAAFGNARRSTSTGSPTRTTLVVDASVAERISSPLKRYEYECRTGTAVAATPSSARSATISCKPGSVVAIKRTSCAFFSVSGMAAITTSDALPACASIDSAHEHGEIQNPRRGNREGRAPMDCRSHSRRSM